MIVEYVRYVIPSERSEAFERAYFAAQTPLAQSEHCLGYELTRCVDDPSRYVLRIEWDSAEGHLAGFRTSPQFVTFLAAIRPFVNDIEEMRHYELTSIRAQANSTPR